MSRRSTPDRGSCPPWCVARHASGPSDQQVVHTGGELLVRRTVLRLRATTDTGTGTQEGPSVLVGSEEFSLHEAEALLAALTQLVDEGTRSLVAQQPQGALPVLDA